MRLALFALLALSARPSAASIAPDARQVVDRYVAAIGGREAVASIHSVYEHGTLSAFGLTGKLESWSERPDRTASNTSIGPITLRDGWDGTTAWRVDPSGKLVMRDGKDLEDAKSDGWFSNDRWLEPDQGGGTVTSLGTVHDSTGDFAVLEIAPPVGRSRKLQFDVKTGLLARTVTRHDQNTVVATVSDYRKAGGILRPFQQRLHVVELPQNDASVTLDSVAVNVEMPPGRFSPPSEAAGAVRWLGTPGLAQLPFEYLSHHLWVKVAVNGGAPEDFLFDTGASVTVLDSAAAVRLGVKAEGRQQGMGAGASGGASFARLDSVTVAAPGGDGVVVRDLRIGVLSLNPMLEPYFWRGAAGVLGFDFISRFVIDVDYDRGTLTLHDPRTYQHQGTGTAVPMTLAGTVPVVEMTLDGKWKAAFRVDLGSGSTVDLHSPFVKQNHLMDLPGRKLDVIGAGFGGSFTTTARRMKSLGVGPFTVPDPLVGLSHAESGAFASEDYAGNLGNRFLDRFRVTLDYERRTLWLEPGKHYAEREVFPRAGVLLLKSDDAVRAGLVVHDSPAGKAGIREGDEIVAIDGVPIAQWNPNRLNDRIDRGPVGSRHTFEVKREDKPVTIALTLREIL